MSEVSVSTNKAEILYYDLTKNEWFSPAGKGIFSRMDIFHNTSNDTYRIVAMTPKNPRQLVLNSEITTNFELTMATDTFAQFEDFEIQFGIKFASKEEADSFNTDLRNITKRLKNAKNIAKGGTTVSLPPLKATNPNPSTNKNPKGPPGKAVKNMTWQEIIDSLTGPKKVTRAAILGSAGKFALASSASFKVSQAEGSQLQSFYEKDPVITQNLFEKGFIIAGVRFKFTTLQETARPLAIFGLEDSGKHCMICFGQESIWILICTEEQLQEIIHLVPEMVLEKDYPRNVYAK
jgi:hypothetical protein